MCGSNLFLFNISAGILANRNYKLKPLFHVELSWKMTDMDFKIIFKFSVAENAFRMF